MRSASASREAIPRQSFVEFGTERLEALVDAVGAASLSSSISQTFRRMMLPWGLRRIGEHPIFRSNVADDEAPFEFSVAFSAGAPEVQFYIDAFGEPPSLATNMHAGRELLDQVAAELGGSVDRLRLVEDLFFPTVPAGRFAIWLGASFMEGREPQLKAYLNPQVQGPSMAGSLVLEAMNRWGFGRSWTELARSLATSPHRFDELGIVSLDLSNADDARVKVYVRHHNATVADINAFASRAERYEPDDARLFYSTLAPGEATFARKPLISEATFTDVTTSSPSSMTLEFPIGSYVADDADAARRITDCLKAFGLPWDAYQAGLRAMATRPLDGGLGINAHVTLRRPQDNPRIGVYFASEAYLRRS